VRPDTTPDRDIKVRTLLDRAADKIVGRFDKQPLVEAEIRRTLSRTYAELGESAEGIRHLQRATELFTRTLGPEHPNTLWAKEDMALMFGAQKDDWREASKFLYEVLQLRRRPQGSQHPDTLRSMHALGRVLYYANKLEEAGKVLEETLQFRRRVLGFDHRDTLQTQLFLALVFHNEGRLEEATNLLEEALHLFGRTVGLEHHDTLWAMRNLALVLGEQGRMEESFKMNERALELFRRIQGPQHEDTLRAMNNLAWFLATAEDPKFRDPRRAVELAKEAVGRHPKYSTGWNTLGVAHNRAGDWKGAMAALQKSVVLRKGGDSNDWFFLAMAHWQLGEKDKARTWYDRAVLWMGKNQPKNPELKRFRAEAEALLQVK
jgi:tetratricopeptide (TPR) repeat protein